MSFDLDRYLDRIGSERPSAPTPDDLFALHRAHVTTIPFENLSIRLGDGMPFDDDALMERMVDERRGGWCFQMNRLFRLAVQALGFEAVDLKARVWIGCPEGAIPMASHQVLHVDCEDGSRFLCDVGFGGGGPMLPIAHDHHGPIELPNFEFRLEDDLGFGRRLSRKEHGNWIDLYSFSETPVHAVDFLHDSYFLSTSPESHFVRQPGVSKVIEGGFLSALDATLKRRTGDEVVEEVIGSVEEWRDILSEHYGIELSAEDAARTFAPW